MSAPRWFVPLGVHRSACTGRSPRNSNPERVPILHSDKPTTRSLSLKKKLAFSVLAAAVVLATLEGILRLGGWGKPPIIGSWRYQTPVLQPGEIHQFEVKVPVTEVGDVVSYEIGNIVADRPVQQQSG